MALCMQYMYNCTCRKLSVYPVILTIYIGPSIFWVLRCHRSLNTLSHCRLSHFSALANCHIVTLSHCHIVTFLSISKLSHCHIVTFVSISKLSHTQLWITTSNVHNAHCKYQMFDLGVLNAIGTGVLENNIRHCTSEECGNCIQLHFLGMKTWFLPFFSLLIH